MIIILIFINYYKLYVYSRIEFNNKRIIRLKRNGVDLMKLKRVQEILNSTDNIDVFYKNSPIWIESVDSNKDNVDITMLDNKVRMNVPVWDLDEK